MSESAPTPPPSQENFPVEERHLRAVEINRYAEIHKAGIEFCRGVIESKLPVDYPISSMSRGIVRLLDPEPGTYLNKDNNRLRETFRKPLVIDADELEDGVLSGTHSDVWAWLLDNPLPGEFEKIETLPIVSQVKKLSGFVREKLGSEIDITPTRDPKEVQSAVTEFATTLENTMLGTALFGVYAFGGKGEFVYHSNLGRVVYKLHNVSDVFLFSVLHLANKEE